VNPESKNRMDGAAWSTVNGAAIEAEAAEEKNREPRDDRPAVAGLGRGTQKACDPSCIRAQRSSFGYAEHGGGDPVFVGTGASPSDR